MRILNLISIIIFSLFCGCAGGGTSGTGGFNYRGTIAGLNGSPAKNATVTIESPSGEDIATTQTEKDGKFEFPNIETKDVVLKLTLLSGESTELLISIPDGKNVAKISLKQTATGFENSIVFEKEQNKSATSSSSSQESQRSSTGSQVVSSTNFVSTASSSIGSVISSVPAGPINSEPGSQTVGEISSQHVESSATSTSAPSSISSSSSSEVSGNGEGNQNNGGNGNGNNSNGNGNGGGNGNGNNGNGNGNSGGNGNGNNGNENGNGGGNGKSK